MFSNRFTAGRRRYSVQFNSMVQVNEETRNRRPIMLSLPPKEDKSKEPEKDENKTDREKEREEQKGETKMDTEEGAVSENNATKKPEGKMEEKTTKDEEVKETKEEGEEPTRILNGLMPDQISSLVRCGVYLIGFPVEPDTLHALLRLMLRLTREHQHAISFAELGGVKLFLGLTQLSTFQGFTSLVTLIIRHILEDPTTMRMTLQKVSCNFEHRQKCGISRGNFMSK